MRNLFFVSALAACLSQPLLAQESLADQKTQLEIDRLEQQVRAAELEALATIRAISGSSATVTTPAETAEAMAAKYAVYNDAFKELAQAVPPGGGVARPVIVFGTEPPPLTAWFVHDENAKNTAQALSLALRQWDNARTPDEDKLGVMAPALVASVISTIVSTIRTDTSIQGSTLKPEVATLTALLSSNLTRAGYSVEYDEFELSRNGLADLNKLLERPFEITPVLPNVGAPETVTLSDLHTRAAAAYQSQFLPNKAAWESQLAAASAAGRASEAKNLRGLLTAGSNLATSVALFIRLKNGLLDSTKGVLNATEVVRLRDLAMPDPNAERPIIYILSNEAALTTLTRRGALLGLRSIPATVRVGVRIEYLYVGNTTTRGSVACLSNRVNIDRTSDIVSNCEELRPIDGQ